MINFREVKKNIYWIGVNDRKNTLWENYWPIPNGMAYNSYVVVDEKITVVEGVDNAFMNNYFNNLEAILKGRKVDYLIINHMEPDHTGCIKDLLLRYPDITLVGNTKTFNILKNFYGDVVNVKIVKDGEELNTGAKKFKFFMTPMLHWPETMMSYLEEDKILFSCDAFGSYGTHDGGIFDDEKNWKYLDDEVMRYYTNIVGKYCVPTQNALKKLNGLDLELICPSHGRIWRSYIDEVISNYDKWSSYKADKGAVIAYASMYGHTEEMADCIADSLVANGIENVRVYDVSKVHPSYIINDIFRYQAVVFGSSAYNNGIFPMMGALLEKIENVGIKNRVFGYFANKSWAGGAVKRFKSFQDEMKWDLIDSSVESKGAPSTQDIELCKKMALEICDKLK